MALEGIVPSEKCQTQETDAAGYAAYVWGQRTSDSEEQSGQRLPALGVGKWGEVGKGPSGGCGQGVPSPACSKWRHVLISLELHDTPGRGHCYCPHF